MKKIAKRIVIMFMCTGVVCSLLNYVSAMVGAAAKPVVKNYGLHDEDGANRYGWMTDVKTMYGTLASPTATVTNYNYFTSANLCDGMKTSNYLNIHTHGVTKSSDSSYYALKCVDSSGTNSYLTLSHISGLSSTAFNSMKVCYLGACQSADSSRNFALAVRNHGAKCTIGYAKSVNTACNYNTIGSYNLTFTTTSATVASAMATAIKGTYNKYGTYGNVDSYKIYGTSSLTYN